MTSILAPNTVEYFNQNGQVRFIKDNEIHFFSELSPNDMLALRREMKNNLLACRSIERIIDDPAAQLEQFAWCRYGRLNETPDFVDGVSTDAENPRPECAANCRFECKVCVSETIAKKLTPREIEVAKLVADRTDKEIAQVLKISPNTVISHVAHIMEKIGVHTHTGIVRWSFQNNLM